MDIRHPNFSEKTWIQCYWSIEIEIRFILSLVCQIEIRPSKEKVNVQRDKLQNPSFNYFLILHDRIFRYLLNLVKIINRSDIQVNPTLEGCRFILFCCIFTLSSVFKQRNFILVVVFWEIAVLAVEFRFFYTWEQRYLIFCFITKEILTVCWKV